MQRVLGRRGQLGSGSRPLAADDVTIGSGAAVTVRTTEARANTLVIAGTLIVGTGGEMRTTAAANFNGAVTISGGVLRLGATGSRFDARLNRSGGVLYGGAIADATVNRMGAFVETNISDTIDFLPGDPGNGLEQYITGPPTFMEAYDGAYDVPFKVIYMLRDGFPRGHRGLHDLHEWVQRELPRFFVQRFLERFGRL